MITINANTDNPVILFLDPTLENPYYLFVFSKLQGCDELIEVLTDISECEEYQKFNLNIDLRSGIYNLAIYEQEDYSNLDPELAQFLKQEKVKVVNICDGCDNFLATTDLDFIITDEDQYIEITC